MVKKNSNKKKNKKKLKQNKKTIRTIGLIA